MLKVNHKSRHQTLFKNKVFRNQLWRHEYVFFKCNKKQYFRVCFFNFYLIFLVFKYEVTLIYKCHLTDFEARKSATNIYTNRVLRSLPTASYCLQTEFANSRRLANTSCFTRLISTNTWLLYSQAISSLTFYLALFPLYIAEERHIRRSLSDLWKLRKLRSRSEVLCSCRKITAFDSRKVSNTWLTNVYISNASQSTNTKKLPRSWEE